MRTLDPTLEDLQTKTNRQYRIKVYLYDVARGERSPFTMCDIVDGTASTPTVDLTPFVRECQITAEAVNIVLEDPTGQFDPELGTNRHLIQEMQCIRVIEGDASIPEIDWEPTFTGHIRGEAGLLLSRTSRQRQVQLSCLSRIHNRSFNRQPIAYRTLFNFPTLGQLFRDIAERFMGLCPAEILVDEDFGYQLCSKQVHVIDLPPMEALRKIAEAASAVVYFDGQGRLTTYQKYVDLEQGIDTRGRTNIPFERVQQIEVIANTGASDVINKVRIIGLDCIHRMVLGEWAMLWQGNLTTGLFETSATLKVNFGDEESTKAFTRSGQFEGAQIHPDGILFGLLEGITDVIEDAINIAAETINPTCTGFSLPGTLFRLGAGFANFQSAVANKSITSTAIAGSWMVEETYTANGVTGGEVKVQNTGNVVIAAIAVAVLVLTTSMDLHTHPVIFGPAAYPPATAAVAFAQLAAVFILMWSLGSADYEVWGYPFDFALSELEAIAVADNVDEFWQENELEIQNDLIDTCEQAIALARAELLYQQSVAHPRIVRMVHNLLFEQGDIMRLPDGRIYLLTDWNYTVTRVGAQTSIPMVSYFCLRSSIEQSTSVDITMSTDGITEAYP